MILSPSDQMIALDRIKSLSVNIAGQLSIPDVDVKAWLNHIIPILRDFRNKFGNHHQFVLVFNTKLDLEVTQEIDVNILWGLISRGIPALEITLNFHISISPLQSSELEDVSDYCLKNTIPALLISGEEISLYSIEGRSIHFYNFISPHVSTRIRHSRNSRTCSEYKLLIEEQRNKQLIARMSEIWHDRKNRILISNRKTERVLQYFLFQWLYDNIHSARVIKEVGKISNIDRTDIEITDVITGDQFIVEVKWMGINASRQKHGLERLEEGIKQMCAYLEREPTAIEGCVVCYDGRQEGECSPYELDNHVARLDYRIVWLESKSGSELASS